MEPSQIISIPHVSIQPNYLTVFHRAFLPNSNRYYTYARHELTRQNDTKGKVSKHAKRRISKAFNWLVFYSEEKKMYQKHSTKLLRFRLNFITLTLSAPQKHSDQVIKSKLLDRFLTKLRRTHGLQHYLWKAERQRNGNVHFHIISDCYIHYKTVQKTWNNLQADLGYIQEYEKKTGKTNPPSTEIKAVRKLRKMQSYVAKYIMKDDTINPIKGRLWYASQSLLNPPTATEIIDYQIDEEIQRVITSEKVREFNSDYSTTMFISFNQLKKYKCSKLLGIFKSSINDYYLAVDQPIPKSLNSKFHIND